MTGVMVVTAGAMPASIFAFLGQSASADSLPQPTPVVTIPGCQQLPLVNRYALPDGGTAYVFKQIDGNLITSPQPPSGFNPSSATDAELKEYDFPARPSAAGAQLTQWEEVMQGYKTTPIPSFCSLPNVRAATNSHWSGFVSTAAANNDFVNAWGNYTQQGITANCNGAQEVSWVGLGGWNSQSLIQAGTGKTGSGYVAWYEYLGPNNTGIPLTPYTGTNLHSGDPIHIFISYETSNQQVNLDVFDNGTEFAFNQPLAATYYDGTSAEWIDERPLVNGAPTPLADFGTNNWSNGNVLTQTGNQLTIAQTTNTGVKMTSDGTVNGTVLAIPSGLDSTGAGFNDTWQHC